MRNHQPISTCDLEHVTGGQYTLYTVRESREPNYDTNASINGGQSFWRVGNYKGNGAISGGQREATLGAALSSLPL